MSNPLGTTYYFGDEAVELTIVPNRIAVFYRPGTSVAARRVVPVTAGPHSLPAREFGCTHLVAHRPAQRHAHRPAYR